MKTLTQLLIATLLTVATSGCITLSKLPEVPDGALELRASSGFFRLDQDHSDRQVDEFDMDVQALYAFTPQFELGPTFRIHNYREELQNIKLEETDQTAYGMMALYNFWPEGTVIPFASIALGWSKIKVDRLIPPFSSIEGTDTGFFVNLGLGARAMITQKASIYGALRYTHLDVQTSLGGDIEELGAFFGLSLFIGGKNAPTIQAPESSMNWPVPAPRR